VNNRDGNRTQNFVYDSLNRIQQAYSSGPKWGETYSSTASAPGVAPATSGIDAWGNMTNHTGVTGKTATEGTFACPANTNNQLTTCGLTYDAAGNAYINNGVTYTYDVENRLVTPGAGNGTYYYDGDGNRMARLFNTSGTEYWRDLGGESAAGGLQHWRQSPRVHLFCGEEGCPP
jgi:YD repeat-containing protein